MGLFDKRDRKKKSDDFDSPVEKIDLSAPEETAAEQRTAGATEAKVSPAAAPAAKTTQISQAAAAQPAGKVYDAYDSYADGDDDGDDYDSSFGIEKAIELMRTLPADNVELVVQVVKLTLESTKIKISTIIDDASRKQGDIEGRIKVLKEEIADFEKEIAQRKEEISALEADHEETSTVKERLQLAEKLSTGKSSPARTANPAGGKRAGTAQGVNPAARPSAKPIAAGKSKAGSTRTQSGGAKPSVLIKK